MTAKQHRHRARPRLRTLLMLVNLVILALPLAGIAVLRLYESALVRQTESELIAQGAFIAASYRAAFSRVAATAGYQAGALKHYGLALPGAKPAPAPTRSKRLGNTEPLQPKRTTSPRWRPRLPVLDLASDPVLPPRPDPQPSSLSPDPLALAVGAELTPVLREAQLVTLAGLRVVDFRGVVVASTGYDHGWSLAHLQEVQRALAGRSLSLLRLREPPPNEPPPLTSISRGGRIRAVVAGPIIIDGRVAAAVVLARTPSNIVKALHNKRYLFLQFAGLLLAVVTLLTLFTSLTINRPLRALMRQARRAARGEKGAVTLLARPVTQEVAQLSQSVAEMAEALEQRADYIRSFAAHVSHEFKTPLTAMKGALELLEDHRDGMSPAEQARFLANLQADVGRLERLVKRLLELARADVMAAAGTTADDSVHCDAAEVIRQVAKRFTASGLRLQYQLPPQANNATATSTMAAIDATTLEAVLTNLLENAQHHAGDDCLVTITLTTAHKTDTDVGDTLRLILSDDGKGVSPANASKVFDPFFTTARDSGGTGLGLAIVKALLQAYRGDITLTAAASGGAQFTLTLPAAGRPRR